MHPFHLETGPPLAAGGIDATQRNYRLRFKELPDSRNARETPSAETRTLGGRLPTFFQERQRPIDYECGKTRYA